MATPRLEQFVRLIQLQPEPLLVDGPNVDITSLQQRRLLVRRAVRGLEIDWNLDAKKRWFEWGNQGVERAEVRDLSVGGACVRALTDPKLEPGCRIVIGIDELTGLVQLRWTYLLENDNKSLYGIEFVDLSTELEEYLSGPFRGRLSAAIEFEWTQPRSSR